MIRPCITPFDDFDLEACSIVTIIAIGGCSRQTQDKIAAELREFVARQITETKSAQRGHE